MSRYNLIDEKWIPVRFPDGRRDELGIRDTLLSSAEIGAIEDPSPLVVASLHRFLLAILYRALEGPTDINQAKILFKDGLPEEKITNYLNKWRDRFWLFDEKFPFGQNPNVPAVAIEPWTKLTAEFNATSNKVLFDHTATKDPGKKSFKECARWIIATMSFSIAGGRGYYPSPSPNAMMCIPMGRNLHETLCYCIVQYPNRTVMHEDSAIWEREPQILPIATRRRMASGYADLYTWQARMLLLEGHSEDGVSFMRFVAGQGFENPSNTPDPMQPYRIDLTNGRLPVQFRENRAIWRDFDSLLPDNSGSAPMTVQNAIKIAGNAKDKLPISIMVLGQRYTPPSANVDFWRMECFTLPEALVGDRNVRTEIQQLLMLAEEVQKTLQKAYRSFARNILSRGERSPEGKDINGFVKQMPGISWYWSRLEARFHDLLNDYSLDRHPDDIRCSWLEAVRETLWTAWEQHRASVSTTFNAWTIRALVIAEGPLKQKLKELQDEIQILEPQKEGV